MKETLKEFLLAFRLLAFIVVVITFVITTIITFGPTGGICCFLAFLVYLGYRLYPKQ